MPKTAEFFKYPNHPEGQTQPKKALSFQTSRRTIAPKQAPNIDNSELEAHELHCSTHPMNSIRRLNVGEARLYREIRLESLRESPLAFATSYESAVGRDRDSWVTQADAAAQGPDQALFIALSDSPIGLVGLYRDQRDHSCGELLQMWVSPDYRGSSLASDLLDHVFDWASQQGFRFIRAEVTENNRRALRFYEKYGFQTVASEGSGTTLTKEVEFQHSAKTASESLP